MGDTQDRLERLEAALYGPTRRTPEADAQERRAEVSRMYSAWRRGEAERPVFDEEEDLRLWALMETYEGVAAAVARRAAAKTGPGGDA